MKSCIGAHRYLLLNLVYPSPPWEQSDKRVDYGKRLIDDIWICDWIILVNFDLYLRYLPLSGIIFVF